MPTLDQMKLEGPEVHEKISQQLYRMDKNMQAMGLGKMTPEDLRYAYGKIKTGIVQLVSQQGQPQGQPAQPPGAPQGLPPPAQSRVQGDQVPPMPTTMGDGRDAMFHSTTPMANAIGGPMMPGQRNQSGAAAIHPMLDDQALLQQRRRARLAGPF